MSLAFRRARPDEAATLTSLALRSKRHWGYDDAFMRAAHDAMQIPPELISTSVTVVAERAGALVGFYILSLEANVPTLRDLWLEPAAIGSGSGALLWKHALASARGEGFRTLRLVSDPHAAGFYAKMGARRVADVESVAVRGRMLPAFDVDVDD